MRILIMLAAAAALMAGLVIGIVLVASMITRGANEVAASPSGALSKVAFVVLWCLVAGSAAGVIGSG